MDWILCKTRDAIEIFKSRGSKTRYLGFASVDKWDRECPRSDEVVCLHAAGASRWKGTSAVVNAWCRHPEWPRLVVLRSPFSYGGLPAEKLPEAPNIEYVTERLDEKAWRKYQNACPVHLCPSEAEGFGHIITEAMSCGAVVITTDGAPMNELITSDRGILVRSARAETMRLGTAYFVDLDDLERQIGRVLEMKPKERWAIGQNARQWYEAQCAAFEDRMRTFLREVRFANASNPATK
jgi:glycosyltransferase involved in cell wall biosynthesis